MDAGETSRLNNHFMLVEAKESENSMDAGIVSEESWEKQDVSSWLLVFKV